MGDFNTYWRMTINNYDERDLALVRQGYPDDIRKLVYTLEVGDKGTPHIQAYIQMKRSVRLSHMKKLFPGANFASQTSAEWRLNQHNYAQKLDDTAASPAVIQNNDPLHTIEGTVRRVVDRIIQDYPDTEDLEVARRLVEREMVVADYTMAKVFVSSTYKTMWKNFGHQMYQCLFLKHQAVLEEANTHTHTHGDEKFSVAEDITDATQGEDSSQLGTDQEDAESQGDEDGSGEETERSSESGGSCSSAEDDFEEGGEQDDWQLGRGQRVTQFGNWCR